MLEDLCLDNSLLFLDHAFIVSTLFQRSFGENVGLRGSMCLRHVHLPMSNISAIRVVKNSARGVTTSLSVIREAFSMPVDNLAFAVVGT